MIAAPPSGDGHDPPYPKRRSALIQCQHFTAKMTCAVRSCKTPRLYQHGPGPLLSAGPTVCWRVVSSWLALPEQAPGNANMTTTELSQAVESVAFMIRGEPRAVELRYLHGLLDC